MGLTITRMTPAAADLIARLHDCCFEDTWEAKFIASLMQTPGVCGYLARLGDAPAGFAIMRVAVDEVELLALGVAPPAQRRGVGGALLEHVMRQAAEKGARVMHLEVAVSNTAGQALYAAARFAESGRRKGYYASGEDALVFSRALEMTTAGE